MDEYGIWSGNQSVHSLIASAFLRYANQPSHKRYGLDAKGLSQTHLNLTRSLIGDTYQYGALFSYSGSPSQVTIRVGISFVSEAQACQNAETEVGDSTFEEIEAQSKALWNEKLSKVEIDLKGTPENVTELIYSSLYRASLTPVSYFFTP